VTEIARTGVSREGYLSIDACYVENRGTRKFLVSCLVVFTRYPARRSSITLAPMRVQANRGDLLRGTSVISWSGTKIAAHHRLEVSGRDKAVLRLRLTDDAPRSSKDPFSRFDETFDARRRAGARPARPRLRRRALGLWCSSIPAIIMR
jgi:hypothetical protein